MKGRNFREKPLLGEGFTVFWSDHARKRLGSRFARKECPDLPAELVQLFARKEDVGACFRVRFGSAVFIFVKLDQVSALVKTVFVWDGPQKSRRTKGKRHVNDRRRKEA